MLSKVTRIGEIGFLDNLPVTDFVMLDCRTDVGLPSKLPTYVCFCLDGVNNQNKMSGKERRGNKYIKLIDEGNES